MPRRYSTPEVQAVLERHGFVVTRQRGSHVRLRGEMGGRTPFVSLVANQTAIPHRTLRNIRAQLFLTREQFERLMEG